MVRYGGWTQDSARRWRKVVGVATAILLTVPGCTGGPDDARDGTASRPAAAVHADRFDAATRDDAEFNRLFRHEFADVDGVRMHYVSGGTGEPLVLLHGWPQSWYEMRGIMPALAKQYTVYAVDLPGLGDSQGSPTGYDKAILARYVHRLVADKLRLDDIRLVAHDLGAGVGFQYASQYPKNVTRYAHLDYPLPGPAMSATKYRTFSWHLAFHSQKAIPVAVVDDGVREYLSLFYPQVAYQGVSFGGPGAPSPLTDGQVNEFARTYQRPQVLTGGFELTARSSRTSATTLRPRPSRYRRC